MRCRFFTRNEVKHILEVHRAMHSSVIDETDRNARRRRPVSNASAASNRWPWADMPGPTQRHYVRNLEQRWHTEQKRLLAKVHEEQSKQQEQVGLALERLHVS